MYYVYLHKKLNGEVFYVGKGKGKRAYSTHNRNRHWTNIANKYNFTVEIVMSDLQEWYAFELEKDLISYYGLKEDGGTLVNITHGGGGNGNYIFTEKDRLLISQKNSGNGNGRADKNIYDFIRLHDEEVFTGTRQSFTDKYGINISDLFKSKVMTTLGWCLLINVDKIQKSKCDLTVYTFKHLNGETIVSNRREFKKSTGIDPKPLFRSKKAKSVQGWSLIN